MYNHSQRWESKKKKYVVRDIWVNFGRLVLLSFDTISIFSNFAHSPSYPLPVRQQVPADRFTMGLHRQVST